MMLRGAIIGVASLVACAGLALIVHGEHVPGWQLLAAGLIVLVGTVFERWRYRHLADRPQSAWEDTGERFRDPTTGKTVEVLFDPRTGERHYVAQPSRPGTESN